ncbi:hypothetical protein [Naasia aerilata]|uniref:Uncharacterized protein n=1 Tax=Naasia aerilata TaxID=1162966 RepID=A0ABN6XNR6_9MICO|nr:hypothetical protein [Naasia aerilata]BDZ46524.1 hypothetical protein GCM10025866_24330 [Naasia aerilata]
MSERPNPRFLASFTFTLLAPVLLAGGYGVVWSIWSEDPAPYRPVLGIFAGAMVVLAVVALIRGFRRERQDRLEAAGNSPEPEEAEPKDGLSRLRGAGQLMMAAGAAGLVLSFSILLRQEDRATAGIVLLVAVVLLSLGGFLYWLAYHLRQKREQGR